MAITEEQKNSPGCGAGAIGNGVWWRGLLHELLGGFAALNADNYTGGGVLNAYALEVVVNGGSVGVVNSHALDAGVSVLEGKGAGELGAVV